jgi:protein-arginine kinase activator protein McsA
MDAKQLVHLVEGIDLSENERVDPREINHFSHPQHNLIIINEKLVDVKCCETFIQFIISTLFYGCAQCNLFFHYKCIKLPATIKQWRFHNHPLTLL